MSNLQIKIFDDEDIKITQESSLDSVKKFLTDQCLITKDVEIKDPFDNKNMRSVQKIKLSYVRNRNTIARVFKADRDSHTKHNRANREIELEILGVMEKEENRLGEILSAAELERVKEERKKLMPFRREKLKEYEVEATDDELLVLDDTNFERFLLLKKGLYLEKKEQEQREKEMLEKAREEAQKEKEEAVQKAKDDAVEKAKEKAEQVLKEKQEIIDKAEKEKEDAEKEKQEIIDKAKKDKQDAVDQERQRQEQEEERKNREKAEKAKEEEAAKEKAEKNKQYQAFLKTNKFDQNIMEVKRTDKNDFEIWTKPKLISKITLK